MRQEFMEIDTAALKIIKYPDPRLAQDCKPVEVFDEGLARLVARMIDIMHRGDGVGLAAPQVGLCLRLFVCNCTGEPDGDKAYVNPTLSNLEGAVDGEEGCLSVPDVTVLMRRAQSGTVDACDIEGKAFQESAVDLPVRCWQHEFDHISGRLIIDDMSEADKIANRRVIKQLEAQYKRKTATSRKTSTRR